MKFFICLSFLILSLYSSSQSIQKNIENIGYVPSKPEFVSYSENKTFQSIDELILFLESSFIISNKTDQTLQLDYIKKSPIGAHYRFNHTFKNTPVFQSFIQANFNTKGQLILVNNNLIPCETQLSKASNHGEYWINTTNGLIPTSKKYTWDSLKHHHTINYYDLDNRLILSYSPRLYNHSPDTSIAAMVYLPNPIVATNQNYGGPFVDNGDKNTLELANARAKVRLTLKNNNGKLSLSDTLIRLMDLNEPTIDITQPSDSFLDFTRDQTGFEDVNVFYHLSSYSKYLREIGFSNLLDSILVDPHGANGDDNSFLVTETYPYQIEYGTGNVDDGEDGQVIVHEFGHTLSVIAAPKTAMGDDRLAMEEGQADYVAMSYSRRLSPNKPTQVFSWDGHNEFWKGFKTNAPLQYNKRIGHPDIDREIWSTALMCIHDKLRKTKSDSLVFSSYFLQSSNSTMPQMAKLILKIDSLLFNGKELGKIWQCFTDQGILDTVPGHIGMEHFTKENIKILNTYEFSHGIGPASLQLPNQNLIHSIEIYNTLGQLLKTISASKELQFNPLDYKPGIYYVRLNSKSATGNILIKLLRY